MENSRESFTILGIDPNAQVTRRTLLAAAFTTFVLAETGCSWPGQSSTTPARNNVSTGPPTPEQLADHYAALAGEALIGLHEDNNGGWRFKSEIQNGNYQTDRDVSAAGAIHVRKASPGLWRYIVLSESRRALSMATRW